MGDENGTRHIIITSENKRNDMGALYSRHDAGRVAIIPFFIDECKWKKKKTKNKKQGKQFEGFFLRGNE